MCQQKAANFERTMKVRDHRPQRKAMTLRPAVMVAIITCTCLWLTPSAARAGTFLMSQQAVSGNESGVPSAGGRSDKDSVDSAVAASETASTEQAATEPEPEPEKVAAEVVSEKPSAEAEADSDEERDAVAEGEAAPLSVAPLTHVRYPETRPQWIDQETPLDDDHETFAVSSGPCETEEEAEQRVAIMTLASVRNQIEHYVDEMGAPCDPDAVSIDPRWVESELVVRRYSGPVDSGGEPQFEAANLIELDEPAQRFLQAAVRERIAATRVGRVVVAAGLGFSGLLGCSVLLGALHSRQRHKPAEPVAPA